MATTTKQAPRQYETENRGHEWRRIDGRLDIFGFERGDIHNGPVCVKCGYGFCHHCDKLPQKDCA